MTSLHAIGYIYNIMFANMYKAYSVDPTKIGTWLI